MSRENVSKMSANITGSQKSRYKTACVSASGSDRPNTSIQNAVDEASTSGKRASAYPVQRRGSRKKTLSLNQEEREALENLIEEVIMGVGDGVMDSDVSSSDEEDEGEDIAVAGHAAAGSIGDATKPDASSAKAGKKFYPGQLKVALKHMHDLPPRFVRKLAKAQQYLDAGGSMYSKPALSVGCIEEEDDTSHQEDTKESTTPATTAASAVAVPERDRDRARMKENKLKDAKKVIRSLLTDREQYVDERLNSTTVSSSVQSASSDTNIHTISTPSSADKAPTLSSLPNDSRNASTTITNSGLSSVVSCRHDTPVSSSRRANINASVTVAEYVCTASAVDYRTGQSLNKSSAGSLPIQAHSYQPAVAQYQLNVPVVHGINPAPVLSQSPPGTQFWIPQAVVPNNGPGFYGSSPPVVGMSGVPAAFSPYAYSMQSSYPTVPAIHSSYQYLYSTSPPSQTLMAAPPYSGPLQPVSYTVLQPEQYVRAPAGPRPIPADFYQNTPPPGYCPIQTRPTGEPRHLLVGSTAPVADIPKKQTFSAECPPQYASALPCPVASSHVLPVHPVVAGGMDSRGSMTRAAGGLTTSTNTQILTSPRLPTTLNTLGKHEGGGTTALSADGRAIPHSRSPIQYTSAGLVSGHCPVFTRDPINSLSSLVSSKTSKFSSPISTAAPAASTLVLSGISNMDSVVVANKIGTPLDSEAISANLLHADSEAMVAIRTSSAPISSNFSIACSLSVESRCADHGLRSDVKSATGFSMKSSGSVQEHKTVSSLDDKLVVSPTVAQGIDSILPTESSLVAAVKQQSSSHSTITPVVSSLAVQLTPSDELSSSVVIVGKETETCKTGFSEGNATLVSEKLVSGKSNILDFEGDGIHNPPVDCSHSVNQPRTLSDDVADIMLVSDASCVGRSDSPAELTATLSPCLTSELVRLFGAPPDGSTEHQSPNLSRPVRLGYSAARELYACWLQSMQSVQSPSTPIHNDDI